VVLHVSRAVAEILLGDYDDDKPWDAVQSLRPIGTRQVFNKAVEWTGSTSRYSEHVALT
jgi:hypothetical protein